MEVIKAATEWAKAEIISSFFFMIIGLSYILGSLGLWKFSSTPLIKALFVPLLIAGGLLLSAGISFYLSSKSKLNNFEAEYKADTSSVIKSEIERTASTMKTYKNVALKVFPAIILIAVLITLFVSSATIKAICIAIIAFLSVLVILDSQALKRIETYNQKLELAYQEIRRN